MSLPLIPLEKILPDPGNVRDDLGDLDELTRSIEVHGLMQPLVVRPDGKGRFIVVDGHRRYEAALRAGLAAAPCLASKARSDRETVEVMLAAAMHKQLSPFEQANAFARLRAAGLDVTLIARRTGYSTATVRDRLALLALPAEARRAISNGQATVKEATSLARQVKSGGNGTATLRAPKPRWLDRRHTLAPAVATACTHKAERVVVGGVGCGQCWEQAIRDDERGGVLT